MQFKSSPLIRYALSGYLLLVTYASLYPFVGWEYRAIGLLDFLSSAWPRYFTAEDLVLNALGYVPLGFLSTAALMPRIRALWAAPLAIVACIFYSGSMEALQTLLPQRVSSNLDFGLNSFGALLGALIAASALSYLPHTAKLYALRHRYFSADASFGLALLLAWPIAALYPQPALFASGNIVGLLMRGIANLVEGIAPLAWLEAFAREWTSAGLSTPQLQTLSFLACISVGLLVGALSAPAQSREHHAVRLLTVLGLLAAACTAASLAATLNFGPNRALEWLNPRSSMALVAGTACALGLSLLPARISAVLGLLALLALAGLSNQLLEDPYYVQNLQAWQQGRFIRFHGLTEWLARLWALVALVYLARRLMK